MHFGMALHTVRHRFRWPSSRSWRRKFSKSYRCYSSSLLAVGIEIMLKKTVVIAAAIAAFMAAESAQARPRSSCDAEIQTVSDLLASKGAGKILHRQWAASTVRKIRKTGRLPDEYVPFKTAQKLGWPNKNDWRIYRNSKRTGRIMFGGDPYSSDALFGKGSFYTADLDVMEADKRGRKRMVYDPMSGKIYITTDKYRVLVEVQNCY